MSSIVTLQKRQRTVMPTIRPAASEDEDAIVHLWHQGWHDAHAELVPQGVLAYRTERHFLIWRKEAQDSFYVARSEKDLIGFVSLKGIEVVKLYVGRGARGTGLASALLSFAERTLRQNGIDETELFCTAGNARAESFYRRQGWTLVETFNDALWVPTAISQKFVVSTHRYRKKLVD
ncbi:N-acetyltransferase family protein [Rhizobium sp. LEGMi135b]